MTPISGRGPGKFHYISTEESEPWMLHTPDKLKYQWYKNFEILLNDVTILKGVCKLENCKRQ